MAPGTAPSLPSRPSASPAKPPKRPCSCTRTETTSATTSPTSTARPWPTGCTTSSADRSVQHERGAARDGVFAEELVGLLQLVQAEGAGHDGLDAFLAEQLEGLRQLGERDVTRAVDLQHLAEHQARVDAEGRILAEHGLGSVADDDQPAGGREGADAGFQRLRRGDE